jgi:hypothetical protein
MSKLRPKRPSPALVISILALCVALGGTAWAAGKIGTKNLKNNAVTAAKIKKNAVTTNKIKNGAVIGSKVNLSTLGTVPSATNATNAVNATNAANFSRYFSSGLKKASPGQNVTLGTIGPFTFTGKCFEESGEARSVVVVTTSAPHSFFYTAEHSGSSAGEFEPGEEQEVSYELDSTDHEWGGYSARYNSFHVASPDGSVLVDGVANNGAGVFDAPCSFQVWWLNGA